MSPVLSRNNHLHNSGRENARVLVVTGSSGGHIFPALAFLETLRSRRNKATDVLLVLPKGARAVPLKDCGCSVRCISICPVQLYPNPKNFIALFRFFAGTLESIAILYRFRPDVVVGFGSLVSVPLVIFSRFMGIDTVIHEQNVIPGRANRLLARFAAKIAVSFRETENYLRNYRKKIVFTGNPIRSGLTPIRKNKALDFFGFSENNPTLLVMGGSQGSHRINACFLETVSRLSHRSGLQIIHLSGPGDYDLLNRGYNDLGVRVRLFSFLEEMQYAYSASDLVLSRAGATTINELVHFRIPAIIIPYPYAYRHQAQNARVLAEKGVILLINDDDLDSGILRDTIDGLLDNPGRIKEMGSRYDGFPRIDANTLFMEAVFPAAS